MKKLLTSLIFLLPIVVWGGPIYIPATNGISFGELNIAGKLTGMFTNNRTLYVAPWGNDTNGNGSEFNPYKTAFDIWRAGDPSSAISFQGAGAYFAAKAGDTIKWIGRTNFVPWMPPLDGVNLTTQDGTTLVRANFSNCVPLLTANRDTLGPMIQPGDNSIVDFRGARLIANNPQNSGVAGFNSTIGAVEGTDTRQFTYDYGTTNKVPNNATIFLPVSIGTTDNIDLISTNTARRTVYLYGGQTRSGWDCIRAHGLVDLFVYQPDIFSTNVASTSGEQSRGIVVSGGVRLKVVGGMVGSGGGTVQNFPIAANGATTTVELDGVKLYRTTLSALGADVDLTSSAILTGTYQGTTNAFVNTSGPFIGDGFGLTNLPNSAFASPFWFTNPAAASSISNAYNVKVKSLTVAVGGANVTGSSSFSADVGAGSTGTQFYDANGTWRFKSTGQTSPTRGLRNANTSGVYWTATTDSNDATDAGFSNPSSGLLSLDNGTPGTFRDLKLRSLIATDTITGNGAGLSNAVNFIQGTGITIVPSGNGRTFAVIATNSPILVISDKVTGITGSAGTSSFPGLTGGSFSRVTGCATIDTGATSGTLLVTIAGSTSAGAWSQSTAAITISGAGTIIPFVFACPGTNSALTYATTFAGVAGPLSYSLDLCVETLRY